jgi:predicted hotdog family 3-hydroxylacyl-ACP dehydratase
LTLERYTELPVRDLMPHSGRMILIDRLLAQGTDFVEAEVCVRADSLFLQQGAVPAWVGVEYMAQACACFAGLEARALGRAAKVGFLLGARDYRTTVPGFEVGATLCVRARPVHREAGGLSVMECRISRVGEPLPLVQATLTVCEVADLGLYLAQHAGAR